MLLTQIWDSICSSYLEENRWQFGGKNTEQTGKTGDNECEDETNLGFFVPL